MTDKPFQNALYYGDNLKVLRDYIPSESVDLIYLDPPFNSNRSYNVLFKDESGQSSEAQITAFDDTWHWGPAAEAIYDELATGKNLDVGAMIVALRQFIHENQMMAYLVMMAARLVELHRVLKPTGSLYLHCDPTASHYLKIILDSIFGGENFKTEIVWKRSSAHSDTKQGRKQHGRIHDIILFYSKTDYWTWNPIYIPYDEEYLKQNYRHIDPSNGKMFKATDLTAAKPGGDTSYDWRGKKPPEGRYWAYSKQNMEQFEKEGRIFYTGNGVPRLKQYLDEMPGVPLQDIWNDIPPIGAQAAERLGYPTQKPLGLLERIILASSNPEDIVLDPFSGCGTAISAAQKLDRRWIGIDITHLAIAMHKSRLKDMFSLEPRKNYAVIGEPEDIEGARQLAQDDRYQFQWWALSLVEARPLGSQDGDKKGKKGSDRGIDGIIPFLDDSSGKPKQVLIQVKSGHVNSAIIRDLRGVLDREKAALGVLITLEPPTSEMIKEAVSVGFYESQLWQQKFPRLQILSIEDLLSGETIKMPPPYSAFKKAQRVQKKEGSQGEFEF